MSSKASQNRYVFVTGGARSGKTSFAVKEAERVSDKRLYLATAPFDPLDPEMALKIERHRAERDSSWQTVEERTEIALALTDDKGAGVILIDCLTLWVSNLMEAGVDDAEISRRASALSIACATAKVPVITVTNEVGWGIVPENSLARRFRNVSGSVNRIMAEASKEAYLVASGLPVRLK